RVHSGRPGVIPGRPLFVRAALAILPLGPSPHPGSHPMRFAALALPLLGLAAPAVAAEPDSHLYELRVYYAAPGKLDALNARFRDHTMKLFEKHGMTNLGYWVPLGENKENKLVYLLSHPSEEARKKAWGGFLADPDWKK